MDSLKSRNELFFNLLKEFSEINKNELILFLTMSLGINVVQTNGITDITAKIMDSISKKDTNNIWNLFYYLSFFYILNQALYFVYYEIQHLLNVKVKSWGRYKLMDFVMRVNNNNFSDDNFTKLISPIHRASDLAASIINDILGWFVPNFLLLMIITIKFFHISPMLSTIFVISNLFIAFYFLNEYDGLLRANKKYESTTQRSDGTFIDLLNNMDKVIYRGTTNSESKKIKKMSDNTIENAEAYYSLSNYVSTSMVLITIFLLLTSISYIIKLFSQKKISSVDTIAGLSILALYRDKLASVIEQLPSFVGYIGRLNVCMEYFKHINDNFDKIMMSSKHDKLSLPFKQFKYDNVSYRYSSGKYIFKNKNLDFNIDNNTIVGITGPSCSGKSTLMKLLIGMYPVESGNIYIDGKNINDIDSEYLRSRVIYVNQSSKLFDKKVIENIMYGCIDPNKCKSYLNKIMKYPKIYDLYENIDIYKKDSGLFGENLSGGQRQIVNMIGGFINPSEILILDEPTNALDPELKEEVIKLINDFKQYKKCIFIITHDKDVFSIFDKEIKL